MADEEFKDLTPKDENAKPSENPEFKPTRVKLPRGKEVIGIIEQRYGGNKMLVAGTDGKNRNCRVPGRLKRYLWLRPGDVVIIVPWELDNTRGDVLYKYRPNQVSWLRSHGHLKTKSDEF